MPWWTSPERALWWWRETGSPTPPMRELPVPTASPTPPQILPGRVSQPATVKVEIQKTRSGVTYADTAGSAAAAAAQDLAEAGVFTGAKIGDQYYFEPDKTVTRSEFLAMVLETAGREVTAVTMTGFSDDDAIPTWAKAYAAAGVADGIVQGVSTEDGAAFRGEDPITFNEAATVLNRVLDVADVELEVWYGGPGCGALLGGPGRGQHGGCQRPVRQAALAVRAWTAP